MPFTHELSKYEHAKTFGLITSPSANIIWTPDEVATPATGRPTGAGRAITAADEEVLCWDVKKGELLSRWRDKQCSAGVISIARSEADPDIYAVGYGDGSIRLWDSRLSTVVISFSGHKSGITTLAFDKAGVRLASGAQDTDIIIWDLVAEVGLYKLRGHKNQITGLQFLDLSKARKISEVNGEENGLDGSSSAEIADSAAALLSTSKDSLIKLWDLGSQHCIETHIAQSNGECWCLGVSPNHDGCITAGNEGELRLWSIDLQGLGEALSGGQEGKEGWFLREQGILYRQGKDRTTGVRFHPKAGFLAAHGSEKAIELWRIRSEAEVQKVLARKRK